MMLTSSLCSSSAAEAMARFRRFNQTSEGGTSSLRDQDGEDCGAMTGCALTNVPQQAIRKTATQITAPRSVTCRRIRLVVSDVDDRIYDFTAKR